MSGTIRVVEITHMGQRYVDADIAGALLSLVDGDDDTYVVKFRHMPRSEYEALPECEGV